MTTLGILTSTTRPNSIGGSVARWIQHQAPAGITASVIDLSALELPFLDEPALPSDGNYQMPHTQAWSQRIKDLDALVIVLAEYNDGMPAPIKNAIDLLYAEWEGKPIGIVGYGWRGAANAARHLTDVLQRVKAAPQEPVALFFTDDLEPDGSMHVRAEAQGGLQRLFAALS